MIDVSRRFFCFGAAAALIVPPPKSFFIVRPPPLIMAPLDKPMFDLPLQQMLELMKKLDEQRIELSAIPRWVVCDKQWYDEVVGQSSGSSGTIL
jgi:hypothetical protein